VAGIPAPELAHRLHRTAIHQAARCSAVGDHHDAAGVHHFGGFGHEPHAAKGDRVAREIPGLARQLQAVTHDIGQLLNLGRLVVVGEHNRLALFFQVQDLIGDGGCGWHGRRCGSSLQFIRGVWGML